MSKLCGRIKDEAPEGWILGFWASTNDSLADLEKMFKDFSVPSKTFSLGLP